MSDVEKGPSVAEEPPSLATSAFNQGKARLRHFLHPSGRRIHVAADPADAEQIRQRLRNDGHDDDFDVYISGSGQHLDALRQTHTHHENKRQELQEKHAEVYNQFANVQGELDALNTELNRMTEHGVSLNAHFDRWGFSAHIKSYDEDDSPGRSGTTTPRRSSTLTGTTTTEQQGATLKLFKTPVLRQYFHKGILWRASSNVEVMSFELFVDLLYVGIIAINGDAAAENATGLSLLRFIITFTLSWKIWNDMALIISWFETDDLFQRGSVLFLLVCLFGYTTNISEAFEDTYATLVGFYLAARMYMVAYLFLISFLIPMVRGVMLTTVIVSLIGIALWIGSIYVEWPNQLALIWIALAVDTGGHTVNMLLYMLSQRSGGTAKAWAERVYEFVPALNIEHRVERTNAFVSLVFGYSVVAILYQSAVNGIDAFFGKGILGLIQAFFFNWIYFEIDATHLQSHAIRRHKFSAFLWGIAHLPFIMSFVLGSGALSRLVVASDTPDAHLENLTEAYQSRSEHEIAAGVRWFYCAGFGVALLNMGVISLTHVHRDMVGQRLHKRWRLAIRAAVAIILICLPLAENLDSLQLVGTVTGLIAFLLMCELWACSCSGSKFLARDKPCRYTGHCGKKDLQAYVLSGKELDLSELGNTSKLKNSGLGSAPI
ncbi:hypothetical protein AMS68_002611 [Peltaster fructicola]|uniref:Uncharacterized protein n=1 Tax=Peltaster fructicola TaxID=286661 RepID=A0A6H0XQT7_9PEZI|nr:hypothetical protein AMS68_002611 [Peltaster fructicola]